MKKTLIALLCLLLLCAAALADEPAQIWIATDIHYLSPSLTDYGQVFQTVANGSGNKLLEHSGELLDSFLLQAREGGADVVVLTGDLTFDGEMASLMDIIERVQTCWDEGMPVLLLPGNHDIGTNNSCDYFDATGSNRVPGISQAEFEALCSVFGRDQALTKDPNSFSFVYPVSDSLWLMLLDANTDIAHNGRFVHRTFGWIDSALTMAEEQGATVLCFSHQNLLPVDVTSYNSFHVENWPELLDILAAHHVKYAFSGHSHMQHTATWSTGLTEYVTASLSIYPLQYAVVSTDGQELTYTTHRLDLYQDEAAARLREPMLQGLMLSLAPLGLEEEETRLLAEYAVDVNAACIAGDQEELDRLRGSDMWPLWRQKARSTFWYTFLNNILEGEE